MSASTARARRSRRSRSVCRRRGAPEWISPAPEEGQVSDETRRSAERARASGRERRPRRRPSARRSRATLAALKRESQGAASSEALSRQARSAAARRGPKKRSAAARGRPAPRDPPSAPPPPARRRGLERSRLTCQTDPIVTRPSRRAYGPEAGHGTRARRRLQESSRRGEIVGGLPAHAFPTRPRCSGPRSGDGRVGAPRSPKAAPGLGRSLDPPARGP